MLFLPCFGIAQQSWISFSPLDMESDESVLTAEELVYFESLNELTYLSNPVVQSVTQENVGSSEAEKVIIIALPGIDQITTLIIQEHNVKEFEANSVNILTGEEIEGLIVGGGDPCIGHYFFTVDNGNINGRINTALGDFLVRSLSNSKVVVYEAISPLSSSCDGCNGIQEGEGGHIQLYNHKRSKTTVSPAKVISDLPQLPLNFQTERRCRIDFVAAVTPNAASNPGWAKSDALATESDMNRAIRNSGIENLSYRLVGFHELSTFSFGNGSNTATTLTAAGANAEVTNLYTDYGADVVLIFYQYAGLAGVAGWSELMTAAPEARDLSLSEINLSFQFTGVHELAHNHGCKHRNDPTVGTIGALVLSARGHRVDPDDPDEGNGPDYVERTIMALRAQDANPEIRGKRILRFSNPSVLWYDWVSDTSYFTGTATRNNAAQMSVYGCTLADLRDPLIQGITLDGPLRSTPGGIVTVYSDRRCNGGVNPVVTYEASVDGAPFTVFTTGGSSTSFNVPLNTVNYVQFRATITCSSGDSYSDLHTVVIRQPCGPSVLFRSQDPEENLLRNTSIELEAISATQIKITLGSHSAGSVQVSDLLGRLLWQGDVSKSFETSLVELPDDFSGEIVVVSFSDGNNVSSKKLHVK